MKKVETIDQWETLDIALREKGYRLWQLQYRWNLPAGFHAWFTKEGIKDDFEVITYVEQVQRVIIKYNS